MSSRSGILCYHSWTHLPPEQLSRLASPRGNVPVACKNCMSTHRLSTLASGCCSQLGGFWHMVIGAEITKH
eukprot:scaffold484077_cov15-Prasinocladus_malaysianus.AAC.1